MKNQSKDTLLEVLTKAYELTREALNCAQTADFEQLHQILDNRERAISIAQTMSERLTLEQRNLDPTDLARTNNQMSQIISNISSMDEVITTYLQQEREKTQVEIAKTFKNKESFKGYNLNKID